MLRRSGVFALACGLGLVLAGLGCGDDPSSGSGGSSGSTDTTTATGGGGSTDTTTTGSGGSASSGTGGTGSGAGGAPPDEPFACADDPVEVPPWEEGVGPMPDPTGGTLVPAYYVATKVTTYLIDEVAGGCVSNPPGPEVPYGVRLALATSHFRLTITPENGNTSVFGVEYTVNGVKLEGMYTCPADGVAGTAFSADGSTLFLYAGKKDTPDCSRRLLIELHPI